jgi:chaperonin cofactor prefoldin
VQEGLNSLARSFGDLIVEVLQSQDVGELKDFLAFLEVHEARVLNAREAAQDRVHKLKIAKKWESPN